MENIRMPHLPVREDWLARRVEPAIDPDRPIIDPHHHLWDRPDAHYLFPQMLADVSTGHNITATVYIQCRSMHRADGPEEMRPVGEVEFANGAAALSASGHYGPCRICAGIVGTADLTLGDRVEPVLEVLERAGSGRFRGIRMPTAFHADPSIVASVVSPPEGLLREQSVAEGVRRMGARQLTLDIWGFQTQLSDIGVLAERAPGTTIVIDHVGGVLGIGPYAGRREELFEGWKADMAALAAFPNVRVKLGGLAMHTCGFGFETGDLPPSSEDLAAAWAPYILTCIDLFGPERAMFESNFPVDKGMVSYCVLWNAFKRLAEGFSDPEKDRLFRRTAEETYLL